jgi:hypothetical protein
VPRDRDQHRAARCGYVDPGGAASRPPMEAEIRGCEDESGSARRAASSTLAFIGDQVADRPQPTNRRTPERTERLRGAPLPILASPLLRLALRKRSPTSAWLLGCWPRPEFVLAYGAGPVPTSAAR